MSLALLVCIGLQKRMNKNQACKVTLVVHLNASSLLTLICTEDEKNNKCLSTNTHGKYGLKMLLVTAQATPTKRKKDEAAASPGYRNVSGISTLMPERLIGNSKCYAHDCGLNYVAESMFL